MARKNLEPVSEPAGDVAYDDLLDESEEERRVLRWRLEQFTRLGFTLTAAAMLATDKADLALARKLVARGCPLATACEILL